MDTGHLLNFDYYYYYIISSFQILFTCMFWLTLRQHMRELHFKYQEAGDPGLALEDKTAPSSSHNVEAAKKEISRFCYKRHHSTQLAQMLYFF